MLIGVVLAVVTVLLILLFVHEPKKGANLKASEKPSVEPERKGFDTRFKVFLAIMVVFTLGNSSDAFLALRAQEQPLGASVLEVILMFTLFSVVYAASSLPAGLLSDRFGRKKLITAGWLIYALTYLGFAMASTLWHVWLLFALYGLYYGIAEGVSRAFVADMVRSERRGTAYGLYHGAMGVTVLPASVIAGWLWQAISPAAPFFFGAALAGMAMVGFALVVRE